MATVGNAWGRAGFSAGECDSDKADAEQPTWGAKVADSTDSGGSEVVDSISLGSEISEEEWFAPSWRCLERSEVGGEEQAEWDWSLEDIVTSRRWRGEERFLSRWSVSRRAGSVAAEGELVDVWCTSEELLEGHAGLRLEAYRRADALRRAEAQRVRQVGCRAARSEAQRVAMDEGKQLLRSVREADAKLRGGRFFDPTTILPDFREQIARRCAAAGCTAVRVENVCNPRLAERFVTDLGSQTATLLFHATSARNMAGIIARGLVVPGSQGVKVANGSAHGVGIYTAATPQLGYAREFQYLDESCGRRVVQFFCCAGRSGDAACVKQPYLDFTVFFDATFVLPCFLVTAHIGAALPTPQLSYSNRLVSELPVLVTKKDGEIQVAYPQANKLCPLYEPPPPPPPAQRIVVQTVVRTQRRRVLYAARIDSDSEAEQEEEGVEGEDHAPVWYDREHRTLTARQLRTMPRSAKRVARTGVLPDVKVDRSRQAPRKRREVAIARRRRRALSAAEGSDDNGCGEW